MARPPITDEQIERILVEYAVRGKTLRATAEEVDQSTRTVQDYCPSWLRRILKRWTPPPVADCPGKRDNAI